MIVLGRHMRQTDANHCTAACTSTICNCPRLVQSKISIVCELHCLPAGCEHRRRACRPCRMQSEVFMRASMSSGSRASLAWDTNRVQRRQRSRRRARPPSSLRRCCERSLPAHAECTWQSSAVQAFRTAFFINPITPYLSCLFQGVVTPFPNHQGTGTVTPL